MFKRKTFSFRLVCSLLIVLFTNLTFSPLARAAGLNLPAPNQFIPLSKTCSFPLIRGLRLDPLNPFNVEFIVDTADKGKRTISKEEASSLIKYFLAGLTIPEKDIWVNLSPYEKNRIIPESTAATDLGKDLLSQDYILKQLLSSLTYPESTTGKEFWNKTYKEMSKTADINNLSVDTFNKIWIVPDEAVVRQNNNTALITKASLKALLEEDMQSAKSIEHSEKPYAPCPMPSAHARSAQRIAHEVMKQTILPKINKDINQGKNFANLRQIYHSLILGIWFKKKFKDSVYKHYINKNLINGIDLKDKKIKDKIYNQYLKAFQKGIYDYIKSEYEPASNKQVKRRYYSGGFTITPGFSLASSSGISSPLDWMAVKEGMPSSPPMSDFLGNPLNIPAKIVGVDGKGKVLTVKPGKDSVSSSIDNESDRFPAHLPAQGIYVERSKRIPAIEAIIHEIETFLKNKDSKNFSEIFKIKSDRKKRLEVAAGTNKREYSIGCSLGNIFLSLPGNEAELVFKIESLNQETLKQLTKFFLRLFGYGYAKAVSSENSEDHFLHMSVNNKEIDSFFELFGYHKNTNVKVRGIEGPMYSSSSEEGSAFDIDEVEHKIMKTLLEIHPTVQAALKAIAELSAQASSEIYTDGSIPEFVKRRQRSPLEALMQKKIALELAVRKLELKLDLDVKDKALGLSLKLHGVIRAIYKRSFKQVIKAIERASEDDKDMVLKAVKDNFGFIEKELPDELSEEPRKQLSLKFQEIKDKITDEVSKAFSSLSGSSSINSMKVFLPTKVQIEDVKEIGEQIQKNIREYFQNNSNRLVRRKPQSFVGGKTEPFTLVNLQDGCFSLRFGDGMFPRWVTWEWLAEDGYIHPRMMITINAKNIGEATILKNIFVSLSLLSMRQVANRRNKFFKKIEQFEVVTKSGEGEDAANKDIVPSESTAYKDTNSLEYANVRKALESLNNLVSSSSLNKEEPGIKQIDGGIALKDISAKFEAQEDSFASSPVWNAFFEAGELKGFRFDIVAIEEIRDLEEVFKPALAKEAARLR